MNAELPKVVLFALLTVARLFVGLIVAQSNPYITASPLLLLGISNVNVCSPYSRTNSLLYATFLTVQPLIVQGVDSALTVALDVVRVV